MYDGEPVQACEISETSHYGVYAELENSLENSFESSFENSFDVGPAPLKNQLYYKPNFDRSDAIQCLKNIKMAFLSFE